MHGKIRRNWQKHELLFKKLEDFGTTLSEEQLQSKAMQNGWSIKQVFHHLFLAEQMSYDSIMSFNFDKKLEKTSLGSVYRTTLLLLALKSPLKFKSPKQVNIDNQIDSIDFSMIMSEWRKKKAVFEHFLNQFPTNRLSFYIFRHPYAGKMNIVQAIKFFNLHISHHEIQIKRICHVNSITY
ncbi:MAG TPA: hypothetical protein DDY13_09930 [Cytophagales bacterium]|jgi:hypothetical protein|nr:hypothetical protein [Cytophagales bacterium]